MQSAIALVAATLAEDARAETAVRVSQSRNSPRAVESLCRLVNINYGALTRYVTSSEPDLRRLQTARDSNGVIVRAVLAVNYAAPAKPQAPVVFIPDTRSADEKLRECSPVVDTSVTPTRRGLVQKNNGLCGVQDLTLQAILSNGVATVRQTLS